MEGEDDAATYPTGRAGEISYSWLEPRSAASATLTRHFCAVTAPESIAALPPRFIALAHRLNLHDFDAAALKDGRARTLTQSVATIEHHPLYPEHPDLQEALRILGLTWGGA